MMAMSGQNPTELKTSHTYKMGDSDVSVSLNHTLLMNFLYNFKISKNISINMCSELYPVNTFRRRQKIFTKFGLGLNFSHNSMATLMDVEEDFSEYEFENL